jgi:hypothetical protein
MSRMVVVAAIAACLLGPVPAGAQETQSQQTPPAGSQKVVTAEVIRPSDGDALSGVVKIEGRGSSALGVERVTVSIGSRTVSATTPEDLSLDVTATYRWASYRLPESVKITPNGDYKITVDALSYGDHTEEASATVVVNNPPVPPSGLEATVKSRVVSLTWAPNPEPDVLGYIVKRYSAGGLEEVSRITRPSFSEQLEPGAYGFRIMAVRASATGRKRLSSAPSRRAAVVVPAPRSSPGPVGRGALPAAEAIRRYFGSTKKGFAREPALPSGPRRPSLPRAPATVPRAPRARANDDRHEEWGKYRRTLPYELEEAEPETGSTGVTRVLDEIVPPDGARWLVMGGALLLVAVFVALLARRIDVPKAATPEPR